MTNIHIHVRIKKKDGRMPVLKVDIYKLKDKAARNVNTQKKS